MSLSTDPRVSDRMVFAGAEAIHAISGSRRRWEDVGQRERLEFLRESRVCLEAAFAETDATGPVAPA